MTDNRTTELREKLDDLIIELDRLDIALDSPASDMTIGEYEQEREKLLDGFMQAIAATLGSGTLTADQVREAIKANSWAETSSLFEFNDSSYQAIADELNAMLGSGTCRITASATDGLCSDSPRQRFELSCGHSFTLDGLRVPVACPVCGKVVSA